MADHPIEALFCPKVCAPRAELSNDEAMRAAIDLACQNTNGAGKAPRRYSRQVIEGYTKMKGTFDPMESECLQVIAGLGFLLYMTDLAQRR